MEDYLEERELVKRLASKALRVCRDAGEDFRDPSIFAVLEAAIRDVILEEFPGASNFFKRCSLQGKVKGAIGKVSEERAQKRKKNSRDFEERRNGGPLFGRK